MSKEDLILKTLQHILRRDSLAMGYRNDIDSKLIDEIDEILYPDNEEDKTGEKFIKDMMDVGDEPKK